MQFTGRHVVSIADFTRSDLVHVLDLAQRMENGEFDTRRLDGKLMATLFFEPSTRTRLSFEAAMLKLGGKVIGFSDAGSTSTKKGESLADTIRMIERYADIIVLRHPRDGAARLASEVSNVPVINGGDGGNQHPSQTFLDLYTIAKLFPKLLTGDGELTIAFAGDLRYGRTVHSLLTALCHFRVKLLLVAPRGLEMPDQYLQHATKAGVSCTELPTLQDAISQADVLYMTRLQEERFPDPLEFDHIRHSYRITAAMLVGAQKHLRILHPLPRVNEISRDVDATPHAHYFTQAGNGIPVRQALVSLVLGA